MVGVRDPVIGPDCAARVPPISCGECLPFTYINCSLNNPVVPPMPTPAELATVTSDVTVYATIRTFFPLFSFSVPLVNPITFSDEPGLGAVDPITFTVGADGIAKTTYRLPTGLTGTAVATVTATTASGKTCSISFVVKLGPITLPHTGGSGSGGTAGVLAVLAGGAIALGGAAALALGRRRSA